MKTWLKRIGLILTPLIVVLFGPVVWNEAACRPQGELAANDSLLPTEHHRQAARTVLTYPEWHIVHAYDDYAKVLEDGDPHDYGYIRAIVGYWGSLCNLSKVSGTLGGFDGPTKQMIYVIGVSFTAELLAKAAYEETLGRMATWVRGSSPATLDLVSAGHARSYADFLQQVPWYRWDFRADKTDLTTQSDSSFRDTERRVALGIEYGVKAAYADVIAQAVAAAGFDALTLRMVVTGLSVNQLKSFDKVKVIDETSDGIVIETPRYRDLTHILHAMAQQGAQFVEIAGNDQIMFTATMPSDSIHHVQAIYVSKRQGYGDHRALVLVPVSELAETLRTLPDGWLEHIHDY